MTPVFHPATQRADLERQLALLDPVLQHLRVESVPRHVLAVDWRGPAAEEAGRLAAELGRRLDSAADAVDDLLRVVRLQLGALP